MTVSRATYDRHVGNVEGHMSMSWKTA